MIYTNKMRIFLYKKYASLQKYQKIHAVQRALKGDNKSKLSQLKRDMVTTIITT